MKKIFAILSLLLMIGMIVDFSPEISPPEKQEIYLNPEIGAIANTTYEVNKLSYMIVSNIRTNSYAGSIDLPIQKVDQIGSSNHSRRSYMPKKGDYSDKERDPGRCSLNSFS